MLSQVSNSGYSATLAQDLVVTAHATLGVEYLSISTKSSSSPFAPVLYKSHSYMYLYALKNLHIFLKGRGRLVVEFEDLALFELPGRDSTMRTNETVVLFLITELECV